MENSTEKIKNIEKMTIEQLKSELQKIGKSTSGNKSSLKKRLLDTFGRNISMDIKNKSMDKVTQNQEEVTQDQEEARAEALRNELEQERLQREEVIQNQEEITRNKERVKEKSEEYKKNIILAFKNFQKIISIYIARGTYKEEEIDIVVKMYSNFVDVIEGLENNKTIQINSEIFKNIQKLFDTAISRGKILPSELVDQGNKYREFINCVNQLFENNST